MSCHFVLHRLLLLLLGEVDATMLLYELSPLTMMPSNWSVLEHSPVNHLFFKALPSWQAKQLFDIMVVILQLSSEGLPHDSRAITPEGSLAGQATHAFECSSDTSDNPRDRLICNVVSRFVGHDLHDILGKKTMQDIQSPSVLRYVLHRIFTVFFPRPISLDPTPASKDASASASSTTRSSSSSSSASPANGVCKISIDADDSPEEQPKSEDEKQKTEAEKVQLLDSFAQGVVDLVLSLVFCDAPAASKSVVEIVTLSSSRSNAALQSVNAITSLLTGEAFSFEDYLRDPSSPSAAATRKQLESLLRSVGISVDPDAVDRSTTSVANFLIRLVGGKQFWLSRAAAEDMASFLSAVSPTKPPAPEVIDAVASLLLLLGGNSGVLKTVQSFFSQIACHTFSQVIEDQFTSYFLKPELRSKVSALLHSTDVETVVLLKQVLAVVFHLFQCRMSGPDAACSLLAICSEHVIPKLLPASASASTKSDCNSCLPQDTFQELNSQAAPPVPDLMGLIAAAMHHRTDRNVHVVLQRFIVLQAQRQRSMFFDLLSFFLQQVFEEKPLAANLSAWLSAAEKAPDFQKWFSLLTCGDPSKLSSGSIEILNALLQQLKELPLLSTELASSHPLLDWLSPVFVSSRDDFLLLQSSLPSLPDFREFQKLVIDILDALVNSRPAIFLVMTELRYAFLPSPDVLSSLKQDYSAHFSHMLSFLLNSQLSKKPGANLGSSAIQAMFVPLFDGSCRFIRWTSNSFVQFAEAKYY